MLYENVPECEDCEYEAICWVCLNSSNEGVSGRCEPYAGYGAGELLGDDRF